MKISGLLFGVLTAALAVSAGPAMREKRKSKFQFTGVNESGAEFGNKNLPGLLGKDYTWPAKSAIDVRGRYPGQRRYGCANHSLQTMTSKGFNTFRIPIMM